MNIVTSDDASRHKKLLKKNPQQYCETFLLTVLPNGVYTEFVCGQYFQTDVYTPYLWMDQISFGLYIFPPGD